MPKLIGPLLSEQAHGKIADSLIYHRRWGKNYARQYHKPLVAPSLKQRTQRRITEFVLAQWIGMAQADKDTWEVRARRSGLGLSGYHYFLRSAQRDLYAVADICGYWSFNERSGDQAYDYSGNANHGTLEPTWPSDCPSRVTGFKPKMGNALSFDGDNEYVDCGAEASLDITDAITIEMWLYLPSSASGINTFLSKKTGWTQDGYATLTDGTASVFRFIWGDANDADYISATAIFSKDTWHHVVITHDGSNVAIYFDGTLVASEINQNAITSSVDNLYIGKRGDGSFFEGTIDEVRILNRVMTPTEIAFLYAKGRP